MAGGRPTKLNFDTHNKIITAIRAGNYIETAAAYAGIDKSTLYDWLKRGEREKQRVAQNPRYKIRKSEKPYVEFSNAVEKALAEAEVRDVAIIAKAAEEQWQAAAWRLERKFPDRWGRKVIEHTDSDRKRLQDEKLKAETELTKERTKLIKGEEKDLSLLEELFRVSGLDE